MSKYGDIVLDVTFRDTSKKISNGICINCASFPSLRPFPFPLILSFWGLATAASTEPILGFCIRDKRPNDHGCQSSVPHESWREFSLVSLGSSSSFVFRLMICETNERLGYHTEREKSYLLIIFGRLAAPELARWWHSLWLARDKHDYHGLLGYRRSILNGKCTSNAR